MNYLCGLFLAAAVTGGIASEYSNVEVLYRARRGDVAAVGYDGSTDRVVTLRWNGDQGADVREERPDGSGMTLMSLPYEPCILATCGIQVERGEGGKRLFVLTTVRVGSAEVPMVFESMPGGRGSVVARFGPIDGFGGKGRQSSGAQAPQFAELNGIAYQPGVGLLLSCRRSGEKASGVFVVEHGRVRRVGSSRLLGRGIQSGGRRLLLMGSAQEGIEGLESASATFVAPNEAVYWAAQREGRRLEARGANPSDVRTAALVFDGEARNVDLTACGGFNTHVVGVSTSGEKGLIAAVIAEDPPESTGRRGKESVCLLAVR